MFDFLLGLIVKLFVPFAALTFLFSFFGTVPA